MLVIHSMDEVMALIKQRLGNVLCVNPDSIDVQFGYIKGEPSVVTGLNEAVTEDIFDDDEVGTAAVKVAGSVEVNTDAGDKPAPRSRRRRRTKAEIEADEAKQAAEAVKSSGTVEQTNPESSDTQQPETKPTEKDPELETKPKTAADPIEEDEPPFKVDGDQEPENLFADPSDNAGTVVDAGSAVAEVEADNPFATDPEPTAAAQNPFASESDNLFEETEEVKPTTETSSNGFSKPAGTSGDEVLDLFA